MSIGADLAAARRQAGMSVAQVSQQTRIREAIVQAIERDDFAICGADFYARGHIRAIAHAIGVDAAPLVQEYDARLGTPPAGPTRRGTSMASTARPGTSMASTARRDASPAAAAGVPGTSGPGQPGEGRRRAGAIALLILLVAAVGVVIYRAEATHPPGSAAAADHKPAAAHHAAHKHAASSAAHRGARHLVVSVRAVSEPCWAELTRRGGATIFEGIIGLGASRTWTLRRAATLSLGNPGAVTVRIDGKRRTGLGPNPVTLSLHPGRRASG